MIVKQQPEDFRVEELTDARPEARGPFALYRLEKTGWTTPDALAAVRRRWKIDARRVSYGGLKDRHAHTIQYFTILHGPARRLNHERIVVEHIGQFSEPYSSDRIIANRFDITLRGLSGENLEVAETALAEVEADGLPNYFDDQRFGSVRPGEPFIARALIAGDFEQALNLALSAPYEFDRASQKREKAILIEHWGDWKTLAERLPQGHARSLITYLVAHPTDFRGAVCRLRPELRGLYLSAYQSHLWNRILADVLRSTLPTESRRDVGLRMGNVPMPVRLAPEHRQRLLETSIPLPSSRTRVADDDPLRRFVDRVLAEDGLTLADMQVRGVREIFFSRGERSAHILARRLRWSSADDETRRGRQKLVLSFELPRGSYATLLIKRIGGDRS